MPSSKSCIEIDPATIVDGIVRCPCERGGQICNAMLGKLTPDMAQFHCDKCRTEVIVRAPVLGIQTDNGRHISNLQNPDDDATFAMLIHADNQAVALRARAMEWLMLRAQHRAA